MRVAVLSALSHPFAPAIAILAATCGQPDPYATPATTPWVMAFTSGTVAPPVPFDATWLVVDGHAGPRAPGYAPVWGGPRVAKPAEAWLQEGFVIEVWLAGPRGDVRLSPGPLQVALRRDSFDTPRTYNYDLLAEHVGIHFTLDTPGR